MLAHDMRFTLTIDDELPANAKRLSGLEGKKVIVRAADPVRLDASVVRHK